MYVNNHAGLITCTCYKY